MPLISPPPVLSLEHISLPTLTRHQLPGGVTLHICSGSIADVCVLSIILPGGNAEAPSNSIATLCAALLREGSAHHSACRIASTLEYHGAWLGANVTPHHTVLTLYALSHTLPKVLPVWLDLVYHPAYPHRAVRVKAQSLAGSLAVAHTDVGYRCACIAEAQAMGKHHPLARVESPDDIAAISPDTLHSFHSSRADYRSTVAVMAAGNITPDTIHTITDAFVHIEASATHHPQLQPAIAPFEPASAGDSRFCHVDSAIQNSLTVTLPAPPRSHPDFMPLHLAVYALGGYFGSRLMTLVRESLGLTYGISASLYAIADGAYIRITSELQAANVYRATEAIAECLHSMAVEPMSEPELQRLRQCILAEQHAKVDSPISIVEQHIAAITSALPPAYFHTKQQAILALTPQSLIHTAQTYLRPELMRIAVAGTKK